MFREEQKCLNVGPKMPYLGVLSKIFKKVLSCLKSASWSLSKLQKFAKKQKCLNLRPKMPYLGIFGLDFENNIFIFEISTLELV